MQRQASQPGYRDGHNAATLQHRNSLVAELRLLSCGCGLAIGWESESVPGESKPAITLFVASGPALAGIRARTPQIATKERGPAAGSGMAG